MSSLWLSFSREFLDAVLLLVPLPTVLVALLLDYVRAHVDGVPWPVPCPVLRRDDWIRSVAADAQGAFVLTGLQRLYSVTTGHYRRLRSSALGGVMPTDIVGDAARAHVLAVWTGVPALLQPLDRDSKVPTTPRAWWQGEVWGVTDGLILMTPRVNHPTLFARRDGIGHDVWSLDTRGEINSVACCTSQIFVFMRYAHRPDRAADWPKQLDPLVAPIDAFKIDNTGKSQQFLSIDLERPRMHGKALATDGHALYFLTQKGVSVFDTDSGGRLGHWAVADGQCMAMGPHELWVGAKDKLLRFV